MPRTARATAMGVVELPRDPHARAARRCSPRSRRCSARSSRGSSSSHYREPLVDWHDELHDRFALPAGAPARSAPGARRSRRARPRRARPAAPRARGLAPAAASRAGSATRARCCAPRSSSGRSSANAPRPSAGSSRSTATAPTAWSSRGRWAQLRDLGDGSARDRRAPPGRRGRPARRNARRRSARDRVGMRRPRAEDPAASRRDAGDRGRAPGVTATCYWPEIFPFTIDLRRATLPPWTS